MYPLGHIGTALFAAILFSGSAAFAVIGVLLPDIVDKIFFTLGQLPCGRSLGHSLIFGPILAAATFAATRNAKLSLSILMGAYLHLVGDIEHFIPWFYPFAEYDFDCGPVEARFDYNIIVLEAVGLALIVLSLKFRAKVVSAREFILRKLRS
jgi:hypothetical protein